MKYFKIFKKYIFLFFYACLTNEVLSDFYFVLEVFFFVFVKWRQFSFHKTKITVISYLFSGFFFFLSEGFEPLPKWPLDSGRREHFDSVIKLNLAVKPETIWLDSLSSPSFKLNKRDHVDFVAQNATWTIGKNMV
jgi:hypothetical protein